MGLTTATDEVFSKEMDGAEDAAFGILILHDWWGTLEYNREWARRFAAEGYHTLVLDLFDGYHPTTTKEAGEFIRNLDQHATNAKLTAALRALHREGRKLAVLGWSFGGVQAQHALFNNPQYVNAAALFYCRLLFNTKNINSVQVPLLAVFAEEESTWPDKQADLELIMAEFDKVLECQSYDAGHGFVNPDSLNYDNEACENAWQTTVDFFNRHLK